MSALLLSSVLMEKLEQLLALQLRILLELGLGLVREPRLEQWGPLSVLRRSKREWVLKHLELLLEQQVWSSLAKSVSQSALGRMLLLSTSYFFVNLFFLMTMHLILRQSE
jgi:hypothetical protein